MKIEVRLFTGPVVDTQDRPGRIIAGEEEGGFMMNKNIGVAEGMNLWLLGEVQVLFFSHWCFFRLPPPYQ